VNPNSSQFLLENSPSPVLFVRSLPENYDHNCVYNIFCNFGKVSKVIFIKEKNSALVEFETLLNAIQAKDELNYSKAVFKVFYSHYETLVLKKIA
jgi:RNA recognition motif-containing protein